MQSIQLRLPFGDLVWVSDSFEVKAKQQFLKLPSPAKFKGWQNSGVKFNQFSITNTFYK